VEFHFGRDIAPGGYAWVFPKGEGIANVGVGMICTGKSEAPPLTYLERFKQRRCAEARPLARVFGGVPAARAPFRVCGRGVFLAGDAGRVADPVSGAGIVPSMESGELAARAAVDHSRGGSTKGAVERKFTAGMKARFKDRSMRFAVRKILSRLSDDELVKMLGLLGEYASRGSILAGDPIGMVKFMLKAMPQTFGVVRHLVRG
jgi:digeranylgeranylglycerophospholipid reductase